ncbi:TSUP family transporter [Streptomyces sp. NPDC053048]|uniref:TSUP family transporter n=1 Tax=Streptomyces sp. NPDC053048 TaxID=3365694 RepID=UPI0037CD5C1B
MLTAVLVVAATFATSVLSAVAGFGGGVLLLSVFIAVFGTRDAVAILTVAQLASCVGRVWFNRAEVDGRLVRTFAVGAVPAAAAGAVLFSIVSAPVLTRVIGGLVLVMVAWRRWRPRGLRLDDTAFVLVGAASGFGSALTGAAGPMVAPFLLARGLVRGAYIGTEAAAALLMHLVKLVVFAAVAVLTPTGALTGLALAPASAAGAWAGKKITDRLPTAAFIVVVELALVAAGLLLLITGG